ncbi:MAG: hypothetical protein M1820_008550 [Bogoriella megaspora]|nr:MAG: hypothetical protein M1820_008550 [Bogoriella megaspora]
MTMKRLLEDAESDQPKKKVHVENPKDSSKSRDRLSTLSDEILVRIFSHLSVHRLNLCQRISSRFYTLAADSQLWKAAYYNRFVRPRAARLPGAVKENLFFSSKLSNWLEEDTLVKRGKETNWKRQYKIRHNWSKGSCGISEIEVAETPPIPPLLVRLHEGVVFTVDLEHGIRAWLSKGQRLLASTSLCGEDEALSNIAPTSLAVDNCCRIRDIHRVVVGFENGAYALYELDLTIHRFSRLHSHRPSRLGGMLSAIALSSPYLLTMNESQVLSLYRFDEKESSRGVVLGVPSLVHSFHSQVACSPIAVTVRPLRKCLTASIAYAFPTYLSGWTVGVQELRLDHNGQLLDSRTASARDAGFVSLSARYPIPSGSQERELVSTRSAKPTTISYSHPYLLVSHPDNTLTLYMITSTESSLKISSGSRLWGHTSSVSGAEIGGRGKAVSVSSRGDELRVWELEGGMASSASRRRLATGDLSVRVSPDSKQSPGSSDTADLHRAGSDLALRNKLDDVSITKGWVGFDEEQVVVLREKGHGSQALVVATKPTKPETVPLKAVPLATTVVSRVTLARTAPTLKKSVLATNAAVLVTSLANVLRTLAVMVVVVSEAVLAVADKNATNAVVSVTLLVTALKAVVDTAVGVVGIVEDMAAEEVMAVAGAGKLATLVAGGEVGHLSRDCPSESTNERVCYKCKKPGHIQSMCPE